MYRLPVAVLLILSSLKCLVGAEKDNLSKKKTLEELEAIPSFTSYRGNYFLAGIPTNATPSKDNSDAKFQVSMAQRVNMKILPPSMFFYLTYTQKSFWNIFQESCPFVDNNYNPSLILRNYFFFNNNTDGYVDVGLEHESNGQGGEDSRSWSFFSLKGSWTYTSQISFGAECWIPFSIAQDNNDCLDYKGIGLAEITYTTIDRRFGTTLMLNPRKGWGNMNFSVEVFGRFKKVDNPYIFLQYYNGYAENMLFYNRYVSMLRFGFLFTPRYQHY